MNTFRAVLFAGVATSLCTGVSHAGGPSVPPEMVYIGPGPSIMGVDRDEPREPQGKTSAYAKRMNTPWSVDAFHDESPAHMVSLDAYFLDRYEVTNKDYGTFIKATGAPAPAYWDDPRLDRPEQPVVGVNWHEAKAYCEHHGKRLPTEAEWEKAARGPHGNLYPWGNTFEATKANFGKQQTGTMPVDAYPDGVSDYGIYNLAGNVFEWVADWYDPSYYGRVETMVNPTGPVEPVWIGGTGTYVDRLTVGEKRVIRGGSWIAPESTLRATHRFWNHPLNNSYGVGLGFRCAKDASPELEHVVRDAYVTALIEMGRERFTRARDAVMAGLSIDPHNEDLTTLRAQLEQVSDQQAGSPGKRYGGDHEWQEAYDCPRRFCSRAWSVGTAGWPPRPQRASAPGRSDPRARGRARSRPSLGDLPPGSVGRDDRVTRRPSGDRAAPA